MTVQEERLYRRFITETLQEISSFQTSVVVINKKC